MGLLWMNPALYPALAFSAAGEIVAYRGRKEWSWLERRVSLAWGLLADEGTRFSCRRSALTFARGIWSPLMFENTMSENAMSENTILRCACLVAIMVVGAFAAPAAFAQQQAGTWSPAAALPQGRDEVQAATVGGKIYLAGGAWNDDHLGLFLEARAEICDLDASALRVVEARREYRRVFEIALFGPHASDQLDAECPRLIETRLAVEQ